MWNKLLKFIGNMLSAESPVSSKRVMGTLGWLIICALFIYCTVTITPAPDVFDAFLIAVVTLLGVDSITNIWKK